MNEVLAKFIDLEFGHLAYYKTEIISLKHPVILFIHGLGEDKSWFPSQFNKFNLSQCIGGSTWIVPDLIGYGESAKPREFKVYTMNQQAKSLLKLLVAEKIYKSPLIIMAHSLGGPIAVSLIEEIIKSNSLTNSLALIYLEGNIDINDTFFSSQIIAKSLKKFEKSFDKFIFRFKNLKIPPRYFEKLQVCGPYSLWVTSNDLVSVSKNNMIINRIQQLTTVKTVFVYGELNKNKFTSEATVIKSNFPIVYIPGTGHFMHLENPNQFWKTMKEVLSSILE